MVKIQRCLYFQERCYGKFNAHETMLVRHVSLLWIFQNRLEAESFIKNTSIDNTESHEQLSRQRYVHYYTNTAECKKQYTKCKMNLPQMTTM